MPPLPRSRLVGWVGTQVAPRHAIRDRFPIRREPTEVSPVHARPSSPTQPYTTRQHGNTNGVVPQRTKRLSPKCVSLQAVNVRWRVPRTDESKCFSIQQPVASGQSERSWRLFAQILRNKGQVSAATYGASLLICKMQNRGNFCCFGKKRNGKLVPACEEVLKRERGCEQ